MENNAENLEITRSFTELRTFFFQVLGQNPEIFPSSGPEPGIFSSSDFLQISEFQLRILGSEITFLVVPSSGLDIFYLGNPIHVDHVHISYILLIIYSGPVLYCTLLS